MKSTSQMVYCCFAFMLSLFCSMPTWAQEKNTLSVGVTLGPNFMIFTGENGSGTTYNPRLGIAGGFLLNYSVSNKIGVTAEFNYANRGTAYNNQNAGVNMQTSARLNYLAVPLYVNWFGGGTESRPKFFFGVDLGLLLNAKLVTKSDGKIIGEIDAKNAYNATDGSFLIGAGWHKRIGEGYWLILDGRLSYNMNTILKANIPGTNPANIRNPILGLRAALTLPLNLPK